MNSPALTKIFQDINAAISVSEFHGLLTGHACVGSQHASGAKRAELYADWLDAALLPNQAKSLDVVFEANSDSLTESSDFDFKPLIPDDDAPIIERLQAISDWCTGFLSGLGLQAAQLGHSDDLRELLEDLASIAALREEVPEDDENENDFMQIEEYVRIAVLNIYQEAQSRK